MGRNKELLIVFSVFVIIGGLLTFGQFQYFSQVERQLFETEFQQKSAVRKSVILSRLNGKVLSIANEIKEHYIYQLGISPEQAIEHIVKNYQIPSEIQTITLLQPIKQNVELSDKHLTPENLLEFFSQQTLYAQANRLIKDAEPSALRAKLVEETFASASFIQALTLAQQTFNPQYAPQFLKTPIQSDNSLPFYLLVPFKTALSTAESDSIGFIVMNVDLASSVLNALNLLIKAPGGLDFYIYQGEVNPNSLLLYHASRLKPEAMPLQSEKQSQPIKVLDEADLRHLDQKEYFISQESFLGQTWRFVFLPVNTEFISSLAMSSEVSIFMSFLFLVLMAGYLVVVIRHKNAYHSALDQKMLAHSESQQRLVAIMNASKDGIVVLKEGDIIEYWSQGAENLFHFSSTEVIGKGLIDLIVPNEQREEMATLFRQLVSKGEGSYNKEMSIYSQHGQLVSVEMTCSRVLISDELYGIVFFHNIENRIHYERTLKDKEERVRTIFDTVPDGIITINALGTIEQVNPAVPHLFGYSQQYLEGKNVNILMPEPYKSQHDQHLRQYLKTGKSNTIGEAREVRGQHKDGRIFPIELSVNEVHLQGRKLFIGVVRDISGRIETEKALMEAKEQAEQANRAKSEFLSSMSHELRTPLNAILGYSQMMHYDKHLPVELKKTSIEIHQAGEHLLSLINDVLDLSKIEMGHLELEPEMCLLSSIIENVLILMDPLATKNNIGIELICQCQGYGVWVDRRRLKQVLINLLSNAIKYNRKYGKVFIRCDRDDSGKAHLSVEDTGLGIAVDRMAQLFTPFNRLGAEFSEIEGTGIGLSITKQLVEMMGGTLSVTSKLGQGSTFTLSLNAQLYQSTQPETMAKQPYQIEKFGSGLVSKATIRILVAEDNEVNQRVISQQLTMLGYASDVAKNGRIAWEMLQVKDYDLLLTDMHMPIMGGVELVQKIRCQDTLHENRKMPIIAFTADAMADSKNYYINMGIDDYLAKPVDIVILNQIIEKWLSAIKTPQSPTQPEPHQPAAVQPTQVPLENSSKPYVDIQILQALIGDDYALNCEILQNFLTLTPQTLANIQAAFERQAYAEVADEAHKLKTSTRTIGATHFTDIVLQLETAAHEEDLSTLNTTILALDEAMTRVTDFVKGYCDSMHLPEETSNTLNPSSLNVLLIDDDEMVHRTLRPVLKNHGVSEVYSALTAQLGLGYVADDALAINLIFCDLNMPDMDGIEVIRLLAENGYQGSLALISGENIKVLKAAEQLAKMHHLAIVGVFEKPLSLDAVALALSKILPTNPVHYPEDIIVSVTAQELQLALQRGELEVYYQPKVSLHTRLPIGMEALVRWNHPEKGLISPMAFIPIAEDEGLIDELTREVIRQAFLFTSQMMQTGHQLKIAINISSKSLVDLDWSEYLLQEAKYHGLYLENITVEVTESRLMADVAKALEILTRLTLKKISVSIDDFGTGFSSLEQLQRIPFKELKLDHSLVMNSDKNEETAIILSSTVQMAKKLNLSIVAEGVETQAEWEVVKGLGCDIAQGYLISPPLNKADFKAWLTAWMKMLKTA